jgi:hypothetical protein
MHRFNASKVENIISVAIVAIDKAIRLNIGVVVVG